MGSDGLSCRLGSCEPPHGLCAMQAGNHKSSLVSTARTNLRGKSLPADTKLRGHLGTKHPRLQSCQRKEHNSLVRNADTSCQVLACSSDPFERATLRRDGSCSTNCRSGGSQERQAVLRRCAWEADWQGVQPQRMCARSQPQPCRMGGGRPAVQAAGAANCCPPHLETRDAALQRVELPTTQACTPPPRLQSKQTTPAPQGHHARGPAPQAMTATLQWPRTKCLHVSPNPVAAQGLASALQG